MSDKKAQIIIDGIEGPVDLPVYEGTTGPDVVDVSSLVSKGIFTYDPGFMSTAACESDITYIDGGKGVLLHRGYAIDELADKGDFLETCYLLLYGELPSKAEKRQRKSIINYLTASNPTMKSRILVIRFIFSTKAPPRRSHASAQKTKLTSRSCAVLR